MSAELPLYKVNDTTLFEVCECQTMSYELQSSAEDVVQWCKQNKMGINEKKTKEMIINFAKKQDVVPDLLINGEKIERVTSSKLLGLIIGSNLSLEEHVNAITSRASQ